jgi:plasmid replication initiation protein
MPKNKLKKEYLVVKSNALNEMRAKEMTMQELRLFSVYLSKINPSNKNTRFVKFPIADFMAIMELEQRNIPYFKRVAYSLVRKTVLIPTERGGFSVFNLFREFTIDSDENGEWSVTIDADDKALPLLFDYQGHYFKYELWNALQLKGKNQLRMYEILKQHEKIGYRIISLADLKGMLGIDENGYPQYKIFKREVLEVCRKALSENTDISFTYESHSKKNRKIYELKFNITKNKDFKSPLALEKFIELGNKMIVEGENEPQEAEDNDIFIPITNGQQKLEGRLTLLMEACNNEFSREQIVVLYDNMPDWTKDDCFRCQEFLALKYREMKMRKPNRSRFGYLKTIIQEDYRYGKT